MALFHKGVRMKIKIPEKVRKKCKKFALDCAGTNADEYAKRNQKNLTKIQLDIAIGKAGEWAAQHYLLNKGWKCSDPDFEIYIGKKKSFDADLTLSGDPDLDVHVKSQSQDSAKKYGISWLFQKKDPLYRDKCQKDLIIGTVVSDDLSEATIVMEGSVAKLVFGEPKVRQLRNSKVAIYLDENEELKL
jgi:hypothetical protein